MFLDDCPFCNPNKDFIHPVMKILPKDITQQFLVLYDQYPVSLGHSLIVTKKNYFNIVDLPDRFMVSLKEVIKTVQDHLTKTYPTIDGFNIGVNQGRYAGQTIFHFHMHIIPRYRGDVVNPRGGVRNVIPGKGDY